MVCSTGILVMNMRQILNEVLGTQLYKREKNELPGHKLLQIILGCSRTQMSVVLNTDIIYLFHAFLDVFWR